MPPLDNEQLNRLIAGIAAGSASALDGLFALLGKRMYALAYGFVRNRQDAEDILSESFVKLVRFAHTFRAGTNGYGFVMRIVRNTALDFLRSRKRTASENIDDFFSLSDERYSPERREDAILLEGAIHSLPDTERRMIYYRYYLDLTVREIAKETGMSKSAAQRAVEGAEKHLRELLSAGQNLEDGR